MPVTPCLHAHKGTAITLSLSLGTQSYSFADGQVAPEGSRDKLVICSVLEDVGDCALGTNIFSVGTPLLKYDAPRENNPQIVSHSCNNYYVPYT
jgi:hypothetical protein